MESKQGSQELQALEDQINQLLSIENQSELIEKVPTLANCILSVLDKVKDIYQVNHALQIISDFLSVAPKKVP